MNKNREKAQNQDFNGFNETFGESVDWVGDFQHMHKGRPLATDENVQEAINRLGVSVSYDRMKKDMAITLPAWMMPADGTDWGVSFAANKVESMMIRFGFCIPQGRLLRSLQTIGKERAFHPVADWITSKPWDGVTRLEALYSTVKAHGEDTDPEALRSKRAFLYRWMLSAVAAAFQNDGVQAHGVLVLQGGQGIGKTRWLGALAPADLEAVADGVTLKVGDRDSIKPAIDHWIVELGELDATFRKSDIAGLKAFITKTVDIMRLPYDKTEVRLPRQTVFAASVNHEEFLADETGNRRFWVIPCQSINADHGLPMQQLWAEVYEQHYLKGQHWHLSKEESVMQEHRAKAHEVVNPIHELILTTFDWDAPKGLWRWLTVTQVVQELGYGYDRVGQPDKNAAGKALRDLGCESKRTRKDGRILRVPPKR